MSTYRTLSTESNGLYKEKGSKFIAYASPVQSPEQVQQQLNELRQKHRKARHYCYAYILGTEGSEFRAFDDGGPKYSAGDPILGQLRSFELTNTLVAVVRYFGGTKLGISGLINAYRQAAKMALEAAEIVEEEPFEIWRLTFAYPDINHVLRLVKELDLTVTERKFWEQCILTLQVPRSKQKHLHSWLEQMGGVELEIGN